MHLPKARLPFPSSNIYFFALIPHQVSLTLSACSRFSYLTFTCFIAHTFPNLHPPSHVLLKCTSTHCSVASGSLTHAHSLAHHLTYDHPSYFSPINTSPKFSAESLTHIPHNDKWFPFRMSLKKGINVSSKQKKKSSQKEEEVAEKD